MIIDAHGHIGRWQNGNLTPEYVIKLMQGSSIDLTLISNLEGVGQDTDQAPPNERTCQAVQTYPHKFRGLVWVNPWQGDSALENTRDCLKQEKVFVGLKFHPYLNRFCFDNPEVRPFVELAEEYDVPVAVHTAYDEFSHPDHVIAVAADPAFAKVNFILYHAGMIPPDADTGARVFHQAAAQLNLYIDISWVDLDRLRRALEIMPIERMLFGTDVPLGGDWHYGEYFQKLEALELSVERRAKLVYGNTRSLFKRL